MKTDHASLKFLKTQKQLSRRIARWMSFLETFDLKIVYQKGSENVIADALTRLRINVIEATDWPSLYLNWPQDEKRLKEEEGETVVAKLKHEKDHFVVQDESVFRLMEDGSKVPFVPFSQRLDTVNKLHCGYGHLGVDGTHNLMKHRAWWPGMLADIRKWVSSCDICQKNRNDKVSHEELHPLPPCAPFKRWALDFVGRLEVTEKGNKWILVGIDHGTRWPIARAVPEATAIEIARFIYEEILMRFGCPTEILTDRGANFLSGILEQYLEIQRIRHIKTTAYHPRTNGLCERFNGLLTSIIRKLVDGKPKTWDNYLDEALFTCRVRCHATTGLSPFFLVYGCNPIIPGDSVTPDLRMSKPVDMEEIEAWRREQIEKLTLERESAREREETKKKRAKELFDARVVRKSYEIDEIVYLRKASTTKFDSLWSGPYRISKVLENGVYELKDLDKKKTLPGLVHSERLKPAINIDDSLLLVEEIVGN